MGAMAQQRSPRVFEPISATRVRLDGRELVTFAGCDYLGLAHDRRVVEALRGGADRCGISAGASRSTTGTCSAHERLEAELARLIGTEACALTPDGFLANLAAAEAIGPAHALADADAHPTLVESFGADVRRYPHLDAGAAAKLAEELRVDGGRLALCTDGVFAATGDVAPLDRLVAILRGPDDLLLADDCHGTGVLGVGGSGTPAHFGLDGTRLAVTTTLAKALGCAGGVVGGASAIIERVRRTTAYVCTTPIAPAMAEAALEALRIIGQEPDRLDRLHDNERRMRSALHSVGIDTGGSPTPIFCFTMGTPDSMRRIERDLLRAGFLAPLVEYPGSPAGGCFRLIVTSEHEPGQIDALAACLDRSLA